MTHASVTLSSPPHPSRAGAAARLQLLVVVFAAMIVLGACTGGGSGSESPAGPAGHHGTSTGTDPVAPARHVGPQGRAAQFVTDCGFSHHAADDPIVHPDVPGASHWHDFFGNTTTDAASTHESLLGGATTCQARADTAAYWAPAVFIDGEAVQPTKSTAYYRVAPGVEPTDVVAHPPDLRMIAGDMHATEAQSTDLVGWACGVSTRHSSTPPSCPASAPLRSVITFQDCWDGKNLDSDDHRSHVANSVDGRCPASHPVHIPQLTFAITYPLSGPQPDLQLASGAPITLHADFVNAWDQAALEREVTKCLHRGAVCGLSSNRDENALFTG